MTFGAILRTYGRLATLHSRCHDEELTAQERQLNARAEELLKQLCTHYLRPYEWDSGKIKLAEAPLIITNMTYDTGPRPNDPK